MTNTTVAAAAEHIVEASVNTTLNSSVIQYYSTTSVAITVVLNQ